MGAFARSLSRWGAAADPGDVQIRLDRVVEAYVVDGAVPAVRILTVDQSEAGRALDGRQGASVLTR